MERLALAALMLFAVMPDAAVAETRIAVAAINELGLELQRNLPGGNENLCVSPYSIQNALAMTYAGADGETRTEMGKVLHFPEEEAALHDSFDALRGEIEKSSAETVKLAQKSKKWGGPAVLSRSIWPTHFLGRPVTISGNPF